MADPHASTDRYPRPPAGPTERAAALHCAQGATMSPECGAVLKELARGLDALDRRLARIESRLTTADGSLAAHREKLDRLDGIASKIGWAVILAVLAGVLSLVILKGGPPPGVP